MTLILDGVAFRLEKDRHADALLVLEVPIAKPPYAWLAQNEEQFCRICRTRWSQQDLSNFDEFKGLGPFKYWARVNAQSLRHQEIYTLDEAADAIALEAYGWERLRDVLRNHDLLVAAETITDAQ